MKETIEARCRPAPWRHASTLGVLLLALACGQAEHSSSPATGGATTLGDASNGGAAGMTLGQGGAELGGVCIPTQQAGDPCAGKGSCSCPAPDERPLCRARFVCDSNALSLEIPVCDLPTLRGCPESMEAAHGMPCFWRGARCDFGSNVSCYCATQEDTSGSRGGSCEVPARWYCGCPDSAGHLSGVGDLGAACDSDLSCDDACFNRYARACKDGLWVTPPLTHECL